MPNSRLLDLRNELKQISAPPYPDKLLTLINKWVEKAIPIIRHDWPKDFDDFSSLIADKTAGNSWNHVGAVTFEDLALYGHSEQGSKQHREAWEKDVKDAQEIQQSALSFLDGLLHLPSDRQRNLSQNDQSVHLHFGDNASVGNLVLSRSINNSFNKIESAQINGELKKTLQALTQAVNKMASTMPNENAEQVGRDLETFLAEAVSESH